MDPTVTSGNIFTTKGVQNHVVSNMWKDTVRRETAMSAKWNSSFNKKKTRDEAAWLDAEIARQSAAVAKQHSPSRALLPTHLRGSGAAAEDGEALRNGVGLGRLALLALHRENKRTGAMPTASRKVGSGTGLDNPVLAVERGCMASAHGRKPVVTGSFFRKNGVF
jgi:hypothetical protein